MSFYRDRYEELKDKYDELELENQALIGIISNIKNTNLQLFEIEKVHNNRAREILTNQVKLVQDENKRFRHSFEEIKDYIMDDEESPDVSVLEVCSHILEIVNDTIGE